MYNYFVLFLQKQTMHAHKFLALFRRGLTLKVYFFRNSIIIMELETNLAYDEVRYATMGRGHWKLHEMAAFPKIQ